MLRVDKIKNLTCQQAGGKFKKIMKKILLVEDDPFLVDIYFSRLKEEGYKVDVAPDGEKALEKIKKTKPDLLVLDIILPKMDGWDLLKRMTKEGQIKKIKVIILSNLGEQKEIKKGLDMGVIKYLVKANYTPSEVVEEIKKILK